MLCYSVTNLLALLCQTNFRIDCMWQIYMWHAHNFLTFRYPGSSYPGNKPVNLKFRPGKRKQRIRVLDLNSRRNLNGHHTVQPSQRPRQDDCEDSLIMQWTELLTWNVFLSDIYVCFSLLCVFVLACFLSKVGGFQWIHSTFGQKRAIHLNMSLLLTPGGIIKLGFNGWLNFDQKFFLVLAFFYQRWVAFNRWHVLDQK